MITRFTVAATAAEYRLALQAPKFHPILMPAAHRIVFPGEFHPGKQAPVLLSRGGPAVDALRWGLIDQRTKKERLFMPAHRSYGYRCLVPVSDFYTETDDGRGPRLVRVRGMRGGLLLLAGVWQPPQSFGPQSFALMLCKAGPDMPQECPYQPVVIDPVHVEAFLAQERSVKPFQEATVPGILKWESVSRLAALTFSADDPFGMECDPGFSAAPTEMAFPKPMLPAGSY